MSTSTSKSSSSMPVTHTFKMTDGWYVFIACIGGVLVADTRVGPVVAGILTIALIYQTNLLIQGK